MKLEVEMKPDTDKYELRQKQIEVGIVWKRLSDRQSPPLVRERGRLLGGRVTPQDIEALWSNPQAVSSIDNLSRLPKPEETT